VVVVVVVVVVEAEGEGEGEEEKEEEVYKAHLMFVDPCITVQFIKKNPTGCNNVSKFYYSIFI
jgi:hypothetical protein